MADTPYTPGQGPMTREQPTRVYNPQIIPTQQPQPAPSKPADGQGPIRTGG